MNGELTLPLLEIRGLTVSYSGRGRRAEAVRNVDLDIAPGQTVGLVGASGSGKSTTAHAIIRLLPPSARIERGSITLAGERIDGLSDRQITRLRGKRIGFVPQDPMMSLNPLQRVGAQVAEALRLHTRLTRTERQKRTVELLADAGFTDPRQSVARYPHELSGGMRQRVLIAIAMACEPELIIADEPTSALDVTVQRQILDRLLDLQQSHGTAMLLITHDLAVASDLCGRIAVMDEGEIVESGEARQVLRAPTADYTRELVGRAPSLTSAILVEPVTPDRPPSTPLLVARELTKTFNVRDRSGRKAPVAAVRSVSFEIAKGETFALVGESGSGKSTTARMAVRLVDPTSGEVNFAGQDITSVSGRALRALRRRFQIVYQNPYSSLDPRQTVAHILEEPLAVLGGLSRAERRRRVQGLLDDVQLSASLAGRHPAELSGGQRQRVAIARALATAPDLIVCDEPVSALDVNVQGRILELLVSLQREHGLAYLFISHDLAVVRQIAHRVGVMSMGQIVEEGPAGTVFAAPTHQYTKQLLASVPGHRGALTA